MMKRVLAMGLLLAAAACGNRTDLDPKPGRSLPPAPYGREESLTSGELLASDPQAVPERSVELRKRSQEREDDPFDLPPRERDGDETDGAVTGGADPG